MVNEEKVKKVMYERLIKTVKTHFEKNNTLVHFLEKNFPYLMTSKAAAEDYDLCVEIAAEVSTELSEVLEEYLEGFL